jgi:hypothetical protein
MYEMIHLGVIHLQKQREIRMQQIFEVENSFQQTSTIVQKPG